MTLQVLQVNKITERNQKEVKVNRVLWTFEVVLDTWVHKKNEEFDHCKDRNKMVFKKK